LSREWKSTKRKLQVTLLLTYSECGNKGVVERMVNYDVKVPKGVEPGTVLKVPKIEV
jgi:metal-sulfur cluster biosynthetic enzyme